MYHAVFPNSWGGLAIPFVVTVGIAAVLGRRDALRTFSLAAVVGAVVETAFFLWLFAGFSRGLDGL